MPRFHPLLVAGHWLADLISGEPLPTFERRLRRSRPDLRIVDELRIVPCDSRAAQRR